MSAIAARSMLRSPSLRVAASRVAAATEASAAAAASRPSIRRLPNLRPSGPAARFLRSPVEMSFCVDSLMPMHSATASAVMTSMLSISRCRRGWLSDAANDDV